MNREGDSPNYEELSSEINTLNSVINDLQKEKNKLVMMLDEYYFATCDFDINLFYPEKAERYNKISNDVWIFLNRKPI